MVYVWHWVGRHIFSLSSTFQWDIQHKEASRNIWLLDVNASADFWLYVTYTANYFLPDGPQLNRHSKLQCHVQILQMYNRDERYTFITIQSISALNWMSTRSNSWTAWADDICSRFFSSNSYTMHFHIIVNLLRWYLICCGKMPEYVTKKLWQICMVCSTVNKQRRISGRTTILVVFHFGWLESSHLQWQR